MSHPSAAALPGRPAAIPDETTGNPARTVRPAPTVHERVKSALRLACAVSAGVLIFDAVILEPNWPEVGRSTEYVPALPPRSPELVVAHLSDPHVGRFGYREREAVNLLRESRPDVILISGDLVRGPRSLPALEAFLGALRAPLGVYVVWGNHDYADGVANAEGEAAIRRAGARLLRNASVRLEHPSRRVHVVGLDDPVTGRDNLKAAVRRVPRRDVCLLVAHTPAIVRDLGNWDIDLVFAGHTHGGQVRLPFVGAPYLPWGTRDFPEGWFSVEPGVRLHVSRGLGWSWLPVRFFCRPRIDIITLRGGSAPRGGALERACAPRDAPQACGPQACGVDTRSGAC